MTITERQKRWGAAAAISLFLHIMLFAVFYEEIKKSTSEETVMNVKLVYAPKKEKKVSAIVRQHTQKTAESQKNMPQRPINKTVKKDTERSIVRKPEISVRPADTDTARPAQDGAAGAAYEGTADTQSTPVSNVGTAPADDTGTEEITDVKALEVTHKTLPEYPAFSRKRKEEGKVTVIVTLENGIVKTAETENSSGYERLDAAAVRASKSWKFNAAGKIRVRIPFVFKIK
ncbi:MAG: TonB family protein [Synergistes sp.]|nr:TonB family protein [Synergistes sp.]